MGRVVESLDDLKELGSWAKENKIQSVRVDGVQIVFSPYAMIEGGEYDTAKVPDEGEDLEGVDDELLYYSSN